MCMRIKKKNYYKKNCNKNEKLKGFYEPASKLFQRVLLLINTKNKTF